MSTKTSTRALVLSTLMGCASVAALAQPAQGPGTGPGPGGPQNRPGMMANNGGRPDAGRMQAFMERRTAQLKTQLKITPAQEGAWNTFIAAMKPPAQRPSFDRDAFDKLTTPQRIDKMRELRTQREAQMDQRANATKTFYAALTPAQQQVFDAVTMKSAHRMGGHMHGHHEHGSMGGGMGNWGGPGRG